MHGIQKATTYLFKKRQTEKKQLCCELHFACAGIGISPFRDKRNVKSLNCYFIKISLSKVKGLK